MVNATLLLPPIMLNFMTILQGQMNEILYNDVIDRYRSSGAQHTIPIKSRGDVVSVSVSLQLTQLTSLDPATGDAVLEARMGLAWRDQRLSWNPAHYDGIETLHTPTSYIWKPDIVLHSGHITNNLNKDNAVVHHCGNVTMATPISIKTRCDAGDSTVVCRLKFGSWTYSCDQISPWTASRSDMLSEYRPSVLWEIVKVNARRSPLTSVCCSEKPPHLTFSFTFRQITSRWWEIFG